LSWHRGGIERAADARYDGGHSEETMTTVNIDHLEVDYWPIMPPEQTPERVRDRTLEFGRAHT